MWKKVVVIIVLTVMVASVGVYYQSSRRASYTMYGIEIMTTTASSDKIAQIIQQSAWELGELIIKEGGGKHFPSFHQGGKSWKDDGDNIIASRSITEFDDKNGNHCVIEDIVIPGKPTVILLKSDTEPSTMELANELMHRFHSFKIKHT